MPQTEGEESEGATMRQLTTALMAVGVLAMLGAASASGDSTTKCFGKQATIVGSDSIN